MRRWFDRRFPLGLPPEAFPDTIERLRGTPARLEERLGTVPADRLTARHHGTWSIQENAGHLLDLEPLWEGRLEDLLAGLPALRAADLENTATNHAHHNDRPLAEILTAFRATRHRVVGRLEALPPSSLVQTALHPRLQEPMTVVDLFFFVAEHDDHHLARISELLR